METMKKKVKAKLWMVEEGADEKFDEIEIEGRDSISREDLEYHRIPSEDYFSNARRNFRRLKTCTDLLLSDLLFNKERFSFLLEFGRVG